MGKTFEFEGTVKEIMDKMTFASGFTKREFVVTEEADRYPQDIKFVTVQNNCSLLDSVKPGDKVQVAFSLRGNLYNGRYYTDLQAFKIDRLVAPVEDVEPPAGPADDFVPDALDDDMPF